MINTYIYNIIYINIYRESMQYCVLLDCQMCNYKIPIQCIYLHDYLYLK